MTEITGINRRAAVAGVLSIPAVGHAAAEPVVTGAGDSITAGYGLPPAQALPAQLERELGRWAWPAEVRGAGVSGDTTAGGLRRVESSVRPTRSCAWWRWAATTC
jgi:acyl-CoA thioesterase-1